ncbi:MAG: hypothetical protein ABH851_06070 [Methanobacteriota archaeon]
MKYNELYSSLADKNLWVFSFNDLKTLYPKENYKTLTVQLDYWRRNGWIRNLKRGLYELHSPRAKTIPDLYIANRMYEPSYVSLETALSHYSIIPEVAAQATSVTTKPTRTFKNHYGSFTYRTIKQSNYRGVRLIKEGGFTIRIAEPEKALADYFYFAVREGREEEKTERLNTTLLKDMDYKKIIEYAKGFNKKTLTIMEDAYAGLRRAD